LSEEELQRLSDDELIAYIRKATDAGRPDWASSATAVLCWRRFDDVVRRVSLRIPRQDIEDVAMTAILSAIRSAFDGVSKGEFVNWLNTIVSRRIADYHRAKEGQPKVGLLPTEHQGEEDVWGEEPSESDRAGEVVVQSVIDECLAQLSPPHRAVVERNVFEDLSAPDTADQVNDAFPDLNPPMSDQNVHQIVKRFRNAMTERLADDDTT
jgi:RNA polymerase sigma factor (sigma-70 family)